MSDWLRTNAVTPAGNNRTEANAQPAREGVYLALFHGSKDPGNSEREKTPSSSPLIGPLEFVQFTEERRLKFRFVDRAAALPYLGTLFQSERDWERGLDPLTGQTVFDFSAELVVWARAGNLKRGDWVEFGGDLYGTWTVFYHQLPPPSPAGLLMPKEDLVAVLHDIAMRVQLDDSVEGKIQYTLADHAAETLETFVVSGAYHFGHCDHQKNWRRLDSTPAAPDSLPAKP